MYYYYSIPFEKNVMINRDFATNKAVYYNERYSDSIPGDGGGSLVTFPWRFCR